MHRYHALLVEPWDGPAGLVFTDGTTCGAALDRNGLRPLRVRSRDDGLVAVASETGAVPLPEGVGVRRARLGPGQLLSVDPQHGLRLDAELKRDLARRRPYGEWVAASIERSEIGEPAPAPEERSGGAAGAPRLHARGVERDAAADRADRRAIPSTRWATTHRSRRWPVARARSPRTSASGSPRSPTLRSTTCASGR